MGDHLVIYSIGKDRKDDGGADGRDRRRSDTIMRVSAKPIWTYHPHEEDRDAYMEE